MTVKQTAGEPQMNKKAKSTWQICTPPMTAENLAELMQLESQREPTKGKIILHHIVTLVRSTMYM
ncbi:hypothetical protein N7461_003397 [Penicillium sp. DV-2018c]|nr:hypothetical protein N7461_003397 [Penicillium sp. DV-2018c]